ncbi:MAG: hypothetical protein KF760_20380 [Candidatus Eremiobacteraeota bacterium]|nr:hypothetical protein [Candidatus Eremiobacteraeota bacterium]MCW5871765.1 hypothetical protein [Candidatus Eremiobacteraeota bacterium]
MTAYGAPECTSNLKNIGTALEMYKMDHSLAQLVPQYFKALPTCPAVQSDTYPASYQLKGSRYEFCCRGNNHDFGGDRPSYSSDGGCITR